MIRDRQQMTPHVLGIMKAPLRTDRHLVHRPSAQGQGRFGVTTARLDEITREKHEHAAPAGLMDRRQEMRAAR